MTLLATVSILLAATPAPAAAPIPGDVLRVGALQPFASIQDAVTAADPGDVIVVDSGLYFEDVAVRETIAIVAGNGSVVIAGHLEVTGLAGDGALLVSNVTVRPTNSAPTAGGCEVMPAVTIRNCRAGVRFQGGGIEGADGNGDCGMTEGPGGTALDIERAFDVSLSGTLVRGGVGEPSSAPFASGAGGLGVRVGAFATLEVDGGQVAGGQGLSGLGSGATGGRAVRVEANGRALFFNTSLQGGRGGNAVGGPGGNGGDALTTLAGGFAQTQAAGLMGGTGGGGSAGTGSQGAMVSGAGNVVAMPGEPVRLDIPTVTLAASPGAGFINGLEPGDDFNTIVSEASGWRYAPSLVRPVHVLLGSPTTDVQPTMTAGPFGSALIPLPGQTLAPGEAARVVWLQATATIAAGTRFTNVRGYVLMDELP